MRRLKKNIRDADALTIEQLRHDLSPLLEKLSQLQATAKVGTVAATAKMTEATRPAPERNNAATAASKQINSTATVEQSVSRPPIHAGLQEIVGDGPLAGDAAMLAESSAMYLATNNPREKALMYWDTLVDRDNVDKVPAEAAELAESEEGRPECSTIPLPSDGSASHEHRQLELNYRTHKARSILTQLREIIATKSFKYVDQIRKAPRKGVKTRGQVAVLELNRHLSFLCQVYAWNRQKMVDLDAGEETLKVYRVLQKDDVQCSTAVLTPNKKGSTKIKLSWIWQSADRRVAAGLIKPGDGDDTETVDECKNFPFFHSLDIHGLHHCSSSPYSLAPRAGQGRKVD